MCSRQGMALQRGMYFRPPPQHGIILMSRRRNAPYQDLMNVDESELVYEGHDTYRVAGNNPKDENQPRYDQSGKPTQNGRFADWVDNSKQGGGDPAVFRVYEKMKDGIWTDRGLYLLLDYEIDSATGREVFKFRLKQAVGDSSARLESAQTDSPMTRQIPSWVKQQVYKRDKGCCVICGASDQLHFDHDLPFSKGGAGITPENVRILCAKHNLQKSNRIE